MGVLNTHPGTGDLRRFAGTSRRVASRTARSSSGADAYASSGDCCLCRCASAGWVALRVIGCRGAVVLIGDGDVIEVDADAATYGSSSREPTLCPIPPVKEGPVGGRQFATHRVVVRMHGVSLIRDTFPAAILNQVTDG